MKDNKLVRFLVNGRSYKTLNEAMEYAKKNDCDRVIKRTIDTDGDSLEENCDTVVWSKKQRCDAYILKESKRLTEGTSNFGSLKYLPLLVGYTYDEVMEMMDYDEDCPQYDDFENEEDYYDALEKFQEDYMDKLGVCILIDEDIDNLEAKINEFNDETKDRYEELTYNEEGGYHDYEHNGDLEDIMIKIEPGYYQGFQLDVDDRLFDYLDEDVKKEQLERFQNFFKELKNEFGLTELEEAYRFSNGETGYTVKKNESCEVKESRDVDNLDDAEPDVKWAVVKPYLDVKLEDDETPTGGTSYAGETFFDFINDLGWTDLEVAEMTEEEWNELLKDCGIKPIFPIKEDLPKDTLDKIYDTVITNGGGNFDPKTGKPVDIKNRYLASHSNKNGKRGKDWDTVITNVNRDEIDKAINRARKTAKGKEVIGVWNDIDSGNSSVDVTRPFRKEKKARKFGNKNDQKSIGHLDKNGDFTQINLKKLNTNESLKESTDTDDKINYTDDESYLVPPYQVEYWEDEEARDQGFGELYDDFDEENIDDAVEAADYLYWDYNVASVEVINANGDVVYGLYNNQEYKDFDGICPYCGSDNTDYVDGDNEEEKYICRDCNQDFLFDLETGECKTRNRRPIKKEESLKEDKTSSNSKHLTKRQFLKNLILNYDIDKDLATKIANQLDDKQIYVCTQDFQGGDFGVGRKQNELEWAETALEWGDVDNLFEDYDDELFLEVFKDGEIIDWIQETWEIGIKPIEELTDEERTELENYYDLDESLKEGKVYEPEEDEELDEKLVDYLCKKLDVNDVMNWLYDHEWMYNSFCGDIGVDPEDEWECSQDDIRDIIDFIYGEGTQAWLDFLAYFDIIDINTNEFLDNSFNESLKEASKKSSKYEYKGYKEGLKDIASDVASLWGAQCFRIVPNFEKRIVTLYCIEDGEEFTTEITFDELKDEYDFDIVKEIINEHNGNLKESKKSLNEKTNKQIDKQMKLNQKYLNWKKEYEKKSSEKKDDTSKSLNKGENK